MNFLFLFLLLCSSNNALAMFADQPRGRALDEDQVSLVHRAVIGFAQEVSPKAPLAIHMAGGEDWEAFLRVSFTGAAVRIAHFVFNNCLVFTLLYSNGRGGAEEFRADFANKIAPQGVLNINFVQQLRVICNSDKFECTDQEAGPVRPLIISVNF